MKIKALLAKIITQLNTQEAAIEAQLLLQHALNVNHAWLIAHQNDALQANIHAAYSQVGWVTCDPRVAVIKFVATAWVQEPTLQIEPMR